MTAYRERAPHTAARISTHYDGQTPDIRRQW